MTHPDFSSHAIGAWAPGQTTPRAGIAAVGDALAHVAKPLHLVEVDGRPAVGAGGTAKLGTTPGDGELLLLGHAPALTPDRLGDRTFLRTYGVDAAFVAGEMANGIASEALVEAVTRAGYLGVFGAAGLSVERVTQAIDRLSTSLPGKTWGVNLIHSPDDQRLEMALVELFLARGLTFVSASAFLDLTPAVVRYRATGLHRDASGAIVVPHRLMAKVSRVEVARKFFEPPPPALLAELVAKGQLTLAEAELAAQIPMADDVTAEADSGGHTDNRPLVLLLPALQALRDEVCAKHAYAARPRVGAAGGLATPASVATAFSMGAAYVVVGSVNQCTREAGTSDAVRELLAQASSTDVAMAPAADMFELGVKVQVLTRGTLFAVRAQRLYELYRAYASIDALPAAVRTELETKFFQGSLEDAWQGCVDFFSKRDPAQLEKAAKDPKHRLALVFRAYLGQASRWANDGVPTRKLDYQVWCGPAMGAFNAWAKGSVLEPWQSRDAVLIARNLLVGACVVSRAAALRAQGVVLPSELEHFAPRTHAELDALLEAPAERPVPAVEAVRTTPTPAREPIAIVGMGALFPKAASLAEYWRLLRTGDDAIGDVPKTHWALEDYFDADQKAPDKTYGRRGGFLSATPFDPTEFGIPPSILEATDTSQLLALTVARMALDDAGYGDDVPWDRSRTSVILGVTGTQELVISLGARLGHPQWKKALADAGVDEDTAQDVMARIGASYVGWQENSFPGLLGNVVAGRIANRFDLGGTNCVVDAACASSLGAMHLGIAELQAGRADMVLSGGVDTLNDIFMHMCFSKTPALSAAGDARPFSDQADGTLLGEGLGMVVLKRLSDAERDGDRVYAVIRGLGTSSDGRAKSIYAPLPSGQARALQAAYRDAGVSPRDVTFVEAHGTGTRAGDFAEFTALDQVFRASSSDPAWCALGAVKAQVGHTKAAAGAAGLIKAALALHHRVLPPTIKIDRPNPLLKLEESPFVLPPAARPWLSSARGPRRAGVSSFGFGGSNFHAVLEEHGSRRGAPAWDGSVELVALPAANVAALTARLDELVRATDLAAFAASSRETFRSGDAHRLVLVTTAATKLDALVSAVKARLSSAPGEAFTLPEGVAYGVGAAQGELAMLFPGQGAQHVDMLRDLACLFPELLESVDAAPDVAQALYPLPTFDEAERARREQQLTRTDVAQPALGLVERGLLAALGRFGVEPRLVAGHSYGELVALHAAGVVSATELIDASRARGRLMAGDQPSSLSPSGGEGRGEGTNSDRGTMLAVLAPLADIERLLSEEKLDLVLANRNTPSQGVLSGARAEIDRAEAACKSRSMRAARLNVGAAFHSPLVAGAATAFGEALQALTFRAPRIPVIANSTAAPYPAEADAARALLANQLARPVHFDGVVEALYAAGARTFLEVGPKTALTGMVKAILGDRSFTALSIDAQTRRGGVFDFGFVLAQLAAQGRVVRLAEWNRVPKPPRWKEKEPRAPKMVVPLVGANYRAPTKPIPPRTPKPIVRQDAPTPVLAADAGTAALVRQHQASLGALQALQEQTARLHQRFLEGQLAAQQQLAALMGGHAPTPVALPAPALPPPMVTAPAIPAPAPVVPQVAPKQTNGKHAHALEVPVDSVGVLLDAVAEATGYPRETLELSMDLEADLGIDSIKRVEILSMVSRRIPGAPAVNPEQLGGLRTLQQVADFVGQGVPAQQPAPGPDTAAVAAVDVKATLLSTVSELTGYPVETLSLEMDLEADLGIDSIKRVEILSLLSRRIPNAPQVNPEKLSGLKTLAQVHDFVAAAVPQAVTPAPAPAVSIDATLLSTVSELTGYPVDTLSLEMDLEADLGIDSIKRVEILSLLSRRIPDAPQVNPEKLSGLKTLAQVRDFVAGARADAAPAGRDATATATPVEPRAPGGPKAASPAGHAPGEAKGSATPLAGRPAAAEAKSVVRRVVVPVRAAAATGGLALPGAPIVVVSDGGELATALASALERAGARALVQSASAALPSTLGGLVLLAPETGTTDAELKQALRLARDASSRLRSVPGAFFVTVTRRDGAFGLLSSRSAGLEGGWAGLPKALAHEWPEVQCRAFDVDAAWHSSDAAQALVEELTNDGPRELGLGPAGRLSLGLRTGPAPARSAALSRGDVVLVTGGARGVTADCARELARATGATLVLLGRSPAPVEEAPWLAAAKDEAAIKKALLEHAPLGQRPSPRQLGDACRLVLAGRDIRATLEGLSAEGLTAEYRQVDVRDALAVARVVDEVRKLGPIRGVVHGAGVLRDKRIEDKRDDDLDQVLDPKLQGAEAVLAATQRDELKLVAFFASVTGRFGRRGQSDYAVANQALVSLAQREALRRPKARVVALDWGPWAGGMVTPALEATFRAEGVSLIPLAAGARAFVDEVLAPPGCGAEIVLGAGFGDELEAPWRLVTGQRVEPSWPVLAAHRLSGREVVPLALMLDWLSEAAARAVPHKAIVALEDVRVLRGVTLDGAAVSLGVWAGPLEGDTLSLELRGPRDQVHVRAVARLGVAGPAPAARLAPGGLLPFPTAMDVVYREQLFHGAALEAIAAIDGLGEEGMSFTLRTHPTTERLLPAPARTWTSDPLAIDGVFQALIVWTRARLGAPSLPSKLGALRWYGRPGGGVLRAVVKVRSVEGASVVSDVELLDDAGALVASLSGYECTVSSSLVRAFEGESSPVRAAPGA